MAKEMHTAYAERLKANAQRVEAMPQEAAALDARLERLRERFKNGDPDMMADELQATIERVRPSGGNSPMPRLASSLEMERRSFPCFPKPPNTTANKSHWDSTAIRRRQRKRAPSCANFSAGKLS